MAKVCLDAGHGGSDPGASGNGIVEKIYTLDTVLEIKRHLERHNVEVILTRSTDTFVDLYPRAVIANNANVDLFVSIHVNAATVAAKGFETYSHGTGANEIKLANCVHGQVIADALYSSNRGTKQADFSVLRNTSMAAILVELAFLTNVDDANLLKKYQKEFAKSIAKGILKYLNIAWIEEKPYGTREVYVDGKLIASSNKVADILKAVEKGLSTTARIELPKI